jgi:hypothetical protein
LHETSATGLYLVIPPLDTRAAAAVDAVGTIPAGTPGFDKCSRLMMNHIMVKDNAICQYFDHYTKHMFTVAIKVGCNGN